MEREEKCTKYFRNLLDGNLDKEDLLFYSWKSVVFVEDPEKFHDISKKLGIEELVIGADGYPFFNIRIPSEEPGLYWGVRLGKDVEEFLEKYKGEYKIEVL